ncbi:hypothetical protein [Candidatus Liberibacter sp.]|uniref:hypothetical protein n=1 Tax=Candidatus Liberibacter sp. TaxID=34022 RepID=UPI0015F44589|nr:hypothetical protein [Candidatus Liberibacter sp.]MBA5723866.1 hypothetical protein [Candidatus Liberibacter sp.]
MVDEGVVRSKCQHIKIEWGITTEIAPLCNACEIKLLLSGLLLGIATNITLAEYGDYLTKYWKL